MEDSVIKLVALAVVFLAVILGFTVLVLRLGGAWLFFR